MIARLRFALRSLAVRNYRLYFLGQVVSVSGNWMQQVAIAWLVLRLTGSAFALGVTTALQTLPYLFLGPWGGLVADRVSKRRLLICTQLAQVIPAGHPLGRGRARRRTDLDGLRPRAVPRRDQHVRQPGPSELRDRDGRPRPGRQRRVAERLDHPGGPPDRPGDRRGRDRHARSRAVLHPERADLRVHGRDAAADAPRGAHARPGRCRGERASCARVSRSRRARPSCGSRSR